MVRCAVLNCENNNKKKTRPKTVRFFRFPKDENIICEKWLKLCGKEIKNINNARVCSDHFEEEDYRLQDVLLNTDICKRRLKTDAAPTKNLPSCSEPFAREDKMCKRTLVHEPIVEILEVQIPMEVDASSNNNSWATKEPDNTTSVATQTQGNLESILKKEIEDLKKRLKEKTNESMDLQKQLQQESEFGKDVRNLFTKAQIKKLRNPQNKVNWCSEDIANAVSLYSAGAKCYELLRSRGHPLPSVSTLKKWAAKLKMDSGLLDCVLNLLNSFEYSEKERLCVLSFGKMKVKSDTALKPAKYVQVAMIRSLYKNWKQVIYYNFDCEMTATIIANIIKSLKNINYSVVAVVCDMCPTNVGLWRELNINRENPFFYIDGQKVFAFADTPHLMKLVRNHFLDTGFIIENKEINSKPIVELLKLQKDLNICHKIGDKHLNVKNAGRQKVKYAVELFSNTVSQALKRAISLGMISDVTNSLETSEFVKLLNDWFDIFNSSNANAKETHRAIALTNEKVSSLRVGDRKTLLLFQKGILLNNASLIGLSQYLEATYQNKYILTRRLQLDDLQRFFGTICNKGGLHDHPTGLQFKYRLRTSILGNL